MSEDRTTVNETETMQARKRPSKDRATAAVFAFLLGWCGCHKFYLGYTAAGLVYLLSFILSIFMIFSFFFTFIGVFSIYVPFIFSIVDGILYLTKTDEEFQKVYVQEHREWF